MVVSLINGRSLAGGPPRAPLKSTKVPLHILPPAGLIHEAHSLQDGVGKHGLFGWREKPVILSDQFSSVLRHLFAWWDGEDCAPDSGVNHVGNAKARLGIILDALEAGNVVDDRPKTGTAGRLLEELKEVSE